ncbi:MAG: hypothetical protein KGJ37_00715 [Verrucomicrobiota bacterium]|nr:hypothetical protein [Verrucomicrobiota bacterium]
MSLGDYQPLPPEQKQRRRQCFTLAILAVLLAAGGIVLALFLKKIPLPARLLLAFGDIVAALFLLLALWQNSSKSR